MYFFRDLNLITIVLFLILNLCWAAGGMMLLAGSTRLRRRELPAAGIALGFLSFVVLTNLFAHAVGLVAACWASSLLLLVGGYALWQATGRRRLIALRQDGPLLIVLILLTCLFQVILRGLAVFDEFLHLPMISVMATGDIPPHFYLDPSKSFAYHYGLQVWSASMVRLAGFTPWSAFDLSRAFVLALTFVLAALFFRRLTRNALLVYAGAFLSVFSGGTRWVLSFLPQSTLDWISSRVVMINSGANTAASLTEAISRTWVLDGMGQVQIPFVIHNSLFVPLHFILGSTGAMPYMTVLLLLLIAPSVRMDAPSVAIMVTVFASLALSGEHLFAMLWAGAALALLIQRVSSSWRAACEMQGLRFWGIVLGLSALLVLVQGGFITETARTLLASLHDQTGVTSLNYHGFSIRWPLALPTAHFEALSPFDPANLALLLIEFGPVLFLAIPVTYLAWRRRHGRHILWVGLALAAVLSMLLPLFIRYGVDRSITRLPGTALWLWLILGLQMLWAGWKRIGRPWQALIVILLCLTAVSGVLLFAREIGGIGSPQFSYYIDLLDTWMSARYWDRLPQDAQVLDRTAFRSVALFGRPASANSGIYTPLPAWSELVAAPDVPDVVSAGYDFVYMDSLWWSEIGAATRETYELPCVRLVDQLAFKNIEFRRLYDLRACRVP